MPPGPAYNWLCVLHSCSEIVYNAAHIRAEQLAPRSAQRLAAGVRRAAGQPRPVETQEFPEDYTPYGSADSGLKSKATIEIESEPLPSTWRAQSSWQRNASVIQPDISPPRGLPEQASILDPQNSSLTLPNVEISLGNDAPAPLSSLPASKPQPATVELAPVVEPPLVTHVEESISGPKRPDDEYQSQILPDSSYSEPSAEVDVSVSLLQLF
jgi:aarF domain-containing kinase